ncbi:MAG: methyltransferase domain-containing protein [Clostridia bacterium]|nr:methyltransferase domain-containing protein [Clostridia bacterium]
MKSLFICPDCGGTLESEGNSYFCKNRHCFDIAKQGYVNLLKSNRSSLKHHGDDKMMVKARRDFLEKGFYSELKDRLCDDIAHLAEKSSVLVDAGCGEGYYTRAAAEALRNKNALSAAGGVDISKDAVAYASKAGGGIQYAVAGVYNMPLKDESADIVLNIFAPNAFDEFKRILKPGGLLSVAYPLENHLMELKQAVYDKAYKNDSVPSVPDGFDFITIREIKQVLHIESNEDIVNLFKMTPYYYKTGADDQKKLEFLTRLDISIEVGIMHCKKDSEKFYNN